MNIAGAFDVHHRQLTFGYLDTVAGEEEPGAGAPLDREHLRAWLARFACPAGCGVHPEGCTGWFHVAEGRTAAHLAEPEPPVRHDRGVTGELFLEIHC